MGCFCVLASSYPNLKENCEQKSEENEREREKKSMKKWGIISEKTSLKKRVAGSSLALPVTALSCRVFKSPMAGMRELFIVTLLEKKVTYSHFIYCLSMYLLCFFRYLFFYLKKQNL
ncbi:hypothetical protein V6Z11_D11G222300 [Gossypium hirsutum]